MEVGTDYMSDPFFAAGFKMDGHRDWEQLALMAAGQGESIIARKISYRRWVLDCGIELWAQVKGAGEVVGLNTHFNGRARFQTRIVKRLPRERRFDTAIGGWSVAAPPISEAGEAEPIDGNFPYVFDTPDGAVYRTLDLPQVVPVQLSAFAFEVHSYPNEEAFALAQKNSDAPLAARAFLPSAAISSSTPYPPASALIAGVITQTETLENRVTERTFEWARIETHGGELDVIVAPDSLTGDLVTGGILHGSFWLSGRILSGSHHELTLLDRLKDRIT